MLVFVVIFKKAVKITRRQKPRARNFDKQLAADMFGRTGAPHFIGVSTQVCQNIFEVKVAYYAW